MGSTACLIGIFLLSLATVGRFDAVSDLAEKVNTLEVKLENAVNALSRQAQLQQYFVQERGRADGNSGVKSLRLDRQGANPYDATTYTGTAMLKQHDHDEYTTTVGMGELDVVLNGIEFRTRHNDYKVRKPKQAPSAKGKSEFDGTDEIKFPPVPPAVLRKSSIPEQVEEMKEWYKAFRDQDYSKRDYRPYFKPLLCYLEAGWTNSNQSTIDESFDSARHAIDAKSWRDLQDKVMYISYTGREHSKQNLAFLPTMIKHVQNGLPVLAQWNYRILCHPYSKDLPLKNIVPVDDLHARAHTIRSFEKQQATKAARYKLWDIKNEELLDDIMAEIPGKDGYGAVLLDYGADGRLAEKYQQTGKRLNAANYHRRFTVKVGTVQKDMHRGFADEYLFAAKTSQDKISSSQTYKKPLKKDQFESVTQKWTYAIPLEVIYLSPIHSWNPYNIAYIEADPRGKGQTGKSASTALPNAGFKAFYRAPPTFFTNPKKLKAGVRFVKAQDNKSYQVAASGIRYQVPVADVEPIRVRFPISPVHQEGSAVWEELAALKDMVLKPVEFKSMYYPGTPMRSRK